MARKADVVQTALGTVGILALVTPETTRLVTEVGVALTAVEVADQQLAPAILG